MPENDEKKSEYKLYRNIQNSFTTHQQSLKVFSAASIIRLLGEYPVDTMTNRVKTSSFPIYDTSLSKKTNINHLKKTIFQDSVDKNFYYKIRSLYQGIKPQFFNRGIQMMTMEAQRTAESALQQQWYFSKNEATATIAFAFGGLSAFLVAYVNQQKVSQQLKTKPVNSLYAVPPMWYRNTIWLLSKSSISYALENSFVKKGIFGTPEQTEANASQRDVADFIGCSLASGICFPFDRVKTMIQAGKLPRGTLKGLSQIIAKEGVSSLWRGSPFEVLLRATGYALFFGTKHVLTEKEEKRALLRP
jgi:hypothetical protein